MKKSRIIIPALAMIAFSVAASITGTVAWFTANRTASVDAGTYAVVKTTSNLEVNVDDGIGTSADNDAKTITVNGKLTDGSFDHLAGNIYTPNDSGSAIAAAPKGQIALASATDELLSRGVDDAGTTDTSDDVTIYTAVTFELSFTMEFGATSTDYALLIDNTAGKTAFTTSGTAKTAKGFRMAFYPATNTDQNARVLADLQTAANAKHINSSSADLTDEDTHGGVAYTGSYLIDSEYNTALPTTAQSRATYEARNDYLGFFDHSKKDSNNKVTLTFTVVAWFEGTDPEIINRATEDFQSVTAALHFEAKDVAA